MMMKKTAFILFIALLLVMGITQMAFAEEPGWEAKFEQEWRAMGFTAAPEVRPAPGGTYGSGGNAANLEFPYAVITPETVNRPDADSMVIVLMGDGFTQEDQAKWQYYTQYYARNLLNYKMFEEFRDIIKIYRIDVVSANSGVTRSDSADGRNLPGIDPKDTYFGGYLWSSGMARLGGVTRSAVATNMANGYVPTNTNCSKNVLLNTSVYGGSGGSLAFATLGWAFIDLVTHEMTHSAAGIPDEYYVGTSQVTGAKSDFKREYTHVHRDWINTPQWQEWSPWYRLLGKNGTTFNPFLEAVSYGADFANLFRPSHNCKMRFLGLSSMYDETGHEEFELCELCKEQWRDQMCQKSKTPLLHFQPYNDQFYDNVPVRLDNKNFILRVPERLGSSGTDSELCKKVYGEQVSAIATVNGIQGSFKITVFKDGVALPAYTDVPVSTPLNLAAGIYTVAATFDGIYNEVPYTLTLRSVEEDNWFEVKPQTIITKVGKYADPWNSVDKTDTLSREWREGTPVALPDLTIDPTRVGGTDVNQFDITYSWHVRNFDGTTGAQLGAVGTYGGDPVNGPSSVGQFVLAIHSKAKAGAPAEIANYNVTNKYPFEITTPYRSANHYVIDGATYTHETVAHDYRGITIVGEGFTEEEQDKFEAAAQDFITKFLDTDPVKRVAERFCFFIENGMSADSGLTKENGAHKDTYYGFQLNADGTLGTYRTDMPMDMIMFNDVWRRDTNMKTWAQWGSTVVLINEEDTQANYNWRHPESNRSAHLATISDTGYTRLIEALVTQFAHVRSNRDTDLLDTYRWMEGPDQNKTFEETFARLVESCYSHEMYSGGRPRPVIVSDAATKEYIFDGTTVLNWDVPETFKTYSYGHELITNTVAADTFTIRYYTDNDHRVGTLLEGPPTAPGFYWAEADLPAGNKYFAKTETDRYGITYTEGQQLPGVNGTGTSTSARVRGFVRFEIQTPTNLKLKTEAHMIKKGDYFEVIPYFKQTVASNAATLDFTFDKAKFQYRAFTPAEGVQMLQWVETENGVRITVMSSGYNVTEYGKVMFSARDDIDLENEDNEIILSANYVVKLEDDKKEVKNEVASTIFTTYGGDPGDMDLILLSNLIDKFGLKKGDPEWNDFRFYDYNNNGEIDIFDITQVAVKINK